MNEISCEVCMDLIPLVQDGVASEDSRRAVEAHVAVCPQCRALLDGQLPAKPDSKGLLLRVRAKLRSFCALLMFLGIFFGVGLLDSDGIFYIVVLMPAIGALGYGVYRWKALWQVPLLVFGVNLLSRIVTVLMYDVEFELFGYFIWTVLMVLFAAVGILIAGLFHFAFRKEKNDEKA